MPRIAVAVVMFLMLSTPVRAIASDEPPTRPPILTPLYVGYASLQMLDGYVTRTGVAQGAAETNPLLAGLTGNAAAMWGIKGGATFASIYVAERLWRKHRRGEAIAVMIISNGVLAAVAARNVAVLRTAR